jgi:hypothetical protein
MNDCSHCWERYIDATALSRQTRGLISTGSKRLLKK